MSTPPTNQTATTVNNTVKSIFGVLQNTVEGIIIADQPWLNTPILKQIFEMILGYFFNAASKAAQEAGTFAVIDLQVANETSNISSALRAVIAAEKTGDAAKIQAAIQDYAKYQSALIHNDGSAPAV